MNNLYEMSNLVILVYDANVSIETNNIFDVNIFAMNNLYEMSNLVVLVYDANILIETNKIRFD